MLMCTPYRIALISAGLLCLTSMASVAGETPADAPGAAATSEDNADKLPGEDDAATATPSQPVPDATPTEIPSVDQSITPLEPIVPTESADPTTPTKPPPSPPTHVQTQIQSRVPRIIHAHIFEWNNVARQLYFVWQDPTTAAHDAAPAEGRSEASPTASPNTEAHRTYVIELSTSPNFETAVLPETSTVAPKPKDRTPHAEVAKKTAGKAAQRPPAPTYYVRMRSVDPVTHRKGPFSTVVTAMRKQRKPGQGVSQAANTYKVLLDLDQPHESLDGFFGLRDASDIAFTVPHDMIGGHHTVALQVTIRHSTRGLIRNMFFAPPLLPSATSAP